MRDLEAFYKDNFKSLMTSLVRMGASPAEAEDVIQEAMIAMLHQWSRIQNPRAFAITVATRAFYRLRSRSQQLEPRLAAGGWVSGLNEEPEPVTSTEVETVMSLLQVLPDRQRVIMAWYIDGYTTKEISQGLGITESTVRSHLRSARSTLAQKIRRDRALHSGLE